MQKKIVSAVKEIVPDAFWGLVTQEAMEEYFICDLVDVDLIECKSIFSREEKAKLKQVSRVDPPIFCDVLPVFLQQLKAKQLPAGERRMIVLICAAENPTFADIKTLEQGILDITASTPLIFVSDEHRPDVASIYAMITVGQPQRKGVRLAFDLDRTLTQWPKEFASMSQRNREAGGFNMVLSTRHEPSGSSCYESEREHELQDFKATGVNVDVQVHTWLDFSLMLQLFPYFSNVQWFDRCLWAKVFYCRLYRIDAYYDDQQRNIDRMTELAPDVHCIKVSDSEPPVMPECLSTPHE